MWNKGRDYEEYISIHSLRMEGDIDTYYLPSRLSISIHSLRMEGDVVWKIVHDM